MATLYLPLTHPHPTFDTLYLNVNIKHELCLPCTVFRPLIPFSSVFRMTETETSLTWGPEGREWTYYKTTKTYDISSSARSPANT